MIHLGISGAIPLFSYLVVFYGNRPPGENLETGKSSPLSANTGLITSFTNYGSSSEPHYKGLSSKFFHDSGYFISIILTAVFSTAFKFY